jgi:sugar lactone lactonase YvrE
VSLQIGPQGSTVYVPLTGSSPAPCSNPNPDGTCPAATGSIYLNTSSDLYRFDPTSHQASRVGAFNGPDGIFNMYDIAIDTRGQLLGVSSGTLYVIDPLTALCTSVGTLDNSANGLTFLPDGRLVAAGSNVEILDASTYAVQRTFTSSYTSSGDIIALPDGQLYWTVQGGNGDSLVRINPANGAMTNLGSTGYSAIYGLGYANSTLFGFNSGHYLIINQTNGSATAGAASGDWYGATTNPLVW